MVKAMSDCPLLLIVDDDPILRRVLAKAMQRRGYEVLTAENVEQAITLANQHTPEYAVIDLKMQGASGLALVPKKPLPAFHWAPSLLPYSS